MDLIFSEEAPLASKRLLSRDSDRFLSFLPSLEFGVPQGFLEVLARPSLLKLQNREAPLYLARIGLDLIDFSFFLSYIG